jgi:formylglycine-generating enzyme required for sulfatase activity
MAGNVWEATRSINASYPYEAQDGREDQLDDLLKAKRERIIRGGSWEDVAEAGQTTFRFIDDDAYYPCAVGVRLACRQLEKT